MARTKFKNKKIQSAAELSQELNGKQKSTGQFMALCPAHNDKNPSLSIKEIDGKIFIKCFAECKYQEILDALEFRGIHLSENILNRRSGLPNGISTKFYDKYYTAHWTYKNKQKEKVGYVVRYENSDGEKVVIPYFKKIGGKWKSGYSNTLKDNRPLYNLPKILKSSNEKDIWIVEGEKCADALNNLRLIATTSTGGSGAPSKSDWKPLAGKDVIIWPDNDKAGKNYVANVLKELTDIQNGAVEIKLVEVEKLGLNEKEDVIDWLAKGNTKNDILDLPLQIISNFTDLNTIVLENGEIHLAVKQAEELLLQVAPHDIFQQSNRLVRIITSENITIQGVIQSSIGIAEVKPSFLLLLLNSKLTFMQKTNDGLRTIDPPAKIVNLYLANTGNWKVKILSGVIYAPTLRRDGIIIDKYGYDKKSGLYFVNTGIKFKAVSENPTMKDAKQALEVLNKPIQDFPFKSEADKSVMLAAMITPLVRTSINSAPLFGFNAPIAGSGKTLLTSIVSIIATGKPSTAIPYGTNKDEEGKQLLSALLQNKPVILFDNIERPVYSEKLCAILTAPGNRYSDRILGKSEMADVPTNVTFLATGNNLTFQGDMTRRALQCTIDPQCEKPESREDFHITGSLEDYVIKNRAKYVKAALTIVKGYMKAGNPKQDIRQFGSFEDWSDLVRSSLVWAGCADPNLTRITIEMEDPVKLNFMRITSIWNEIYGEESITVSELIADCNKAMGGYNTKSNQYELAQAFLEVTKSNNKLLNGDSVGKWLRSNKEKIIEGYKIVKDPLLSTNRVYWKLEKI